MGKRRIEVSKVSDEEWLLIDPDSGSVVGNIDRYGLSALGLGDSELKYLNAYSGDRTDFVDRELGEERGVVPFKPYNKYGKINIEFIEKGFAIGMTSKDFSFLLFLMAHVKLEGNGVKKSNNRYMDVSGIMKGLKVSQSQAYRLLQRAKDFDIIRYDENGHMIFNPFIFYRTGHNISYLTYTLFKDSRWRTF